MKKFILILLSVLFCVSMFSCEGDVVTLSSSEDTLSEVVSEVSSVEDISSILETSSQQSTSSETVSSVVETISADEIKADFIKVQNRLFDYEFLALDSEGVLYGYEEDTNTFDVLMKDVKDFSWEDLKNTYVLAGRKGGMPQMVFEYILKQNGLDPASDLKMNQSIGSTAAAFPDSGADYTVEFEPHATALEKEGKGYVVASLGKDSGYVPYTAFCAKQSFIKENPTIIQGFTNALQKGMDYVNSHTPAEIADIIQPQFKETDLDTIVSIITRYYEQDTWKSDLIFEEESFELLQDILADAGELEKSAPYQELVTTEYAEKAAK